ncbi:MAG: dihydropteroate synthase [Bacteroidetes bacterium MED-G13]|nr:dihydropteroate synthase [Flavobacteriaceae bacterium]PDH46512.1 MAG: dihydropteroate synthase [Bacteroidetes bacterium MED-G13]|tara:strand:- start:10592 stop:11419 length:828 start_codon:yes stop_codon:yes gene_type:complete
MTLNIRGELLDLSTQKVMGILNVTPDSFYDGGYYNSNAKILKQVEKMIRDGATIIDIGGYSSRPGADDIPEKIELDRVIPSLKDCKKYFPETYFSIDTFRSKVAEECINNGADIINDISGGNLDNNMMKAVGKYQIPYIIMHMKGNPSNMVKKAKYDDIIGELISYFSKKIDDAAKFNIKDVIIDPGFGFAKNISQNFELLNNLDFFKNLKMPLLVGLSRKSMIYKTLNIKPDKALNGSTVLQTISLIKGANILRVHDVKEAIECIKLIEELKKN